MHKATVQIYSGKKLSQIRKEYPLLQHVPIPSANSFHEVGHMAVAYANSIGFTDKGLVAHKVSNIEIDDKHEVYTVTLEVTEL